MPRPSSRNPAVPVIVPLFHDAGLGVGVLRILIGIIGACLGNVFEIVTSRPPCLLAGRVGFDDG